MATKSVIFVWLWRDTECIDNFICIMDYEMTMCDHLYVTISHHSVLLDYSDQRRVILVLLTKCAPETNGNRSRVGAVSDGERRWGKRGIVRTMGHNGCFN